MTITDEMLAGAAAAAAERYLDTLPGRENCGHEFSPAFEEKMRPLLSGRLQKHRRWKWALVLAALVAALMVGGASVYAERKPTYRVNWTQEDGFVSYHIQAERDILGRLHPMGPDYLPEGCILQNESTEKWGCSAYYRNQAGDTIAFQQTVQECKSGMIVGEVQAKCVDIGGQEGMLAQYEDGRISLLWTDGPNILELICAGLSEEEVLETAEHINYQGGT